MVGVVVDELAAGIKGDLVDQVPAHTECCGGRGDTHPVNGEALQDPSGYSVGELGSVIRAAQAGLEDSSRTVGVGAVKSGYPNVESGGKPDDGQVDEIADDVVALGAWELAGRAGGIDGDGGGVDVGEVVFGGGVGDGQAEFDGAA